MAARRAPGAVSATGIAPANSPPLGLPLGFFVAGVPAFVAINLIAILQPGDTFGDTFNEAPVFDGGLNPASVETLEPSSVITIPHGAALALIGHSPHSALILLASFAARLRGFAQLVESLAFDDVNRRLARFIAQLVHTEGRRQAEGIVLARSLTVQDIAAMVGTVREVVTCGLAQLEREGLLQVSRSALVVLDLAGLERFGEE